MCAHIHVPEPAVVVLSCAPGAACRPAVLCCAANTDATPKVPFGLVEDTVGFLREERSPWSAEAKVGWDQAFLNDC